MMKFFVHPLILNISTHFSESNARMMPDFNMLMSTINKQINE